MSGWALGWVLAISLAVAGPPAAASEVEGVAFDPRIEVDGDALPLRGTGLLRYKVFFKGYVAALYLEEEIAPQAALGDVPRRLEIEYFWAIPADAFARATLEGIQRNVDPIQLETLREPIARLSALYRDVEPGDRYSLTYVPGAGTELALNGGFLGRVEGADFAAAVFAIWLGEQPLDEGLKARLLGGSSG